MKRALEEYRIIGIRTNIPFHQYLLQNPSFQAGDFDTQFIRHDDKILSEIAALAAVLAAHEHSQKSALDMQRSKRDPSNWKWVSRWEQTRE